MNGQHLSATAHTGSRNGVVVVGAGPVGCAAALLLADQGVPITLLERHTQPHPLPRAVHLDDEVARTLYRAGVSEEFLARSRSCSGLRLLDADHRVMAEFRREHEVGIHGFPQANMFHQPDLEDLLLARVGRHPLIDFHRGVEVTGLDSAFGPLTGDPVEVHAELAPDGPGRTFTGRLVLGCDGANSAIRDLSGIIMEDLGFTERWLVIDIRSEKLLDTWDGVEQICDPARAGTFMQVTGHRYRWEFQLHDGEDEASMITPDALGRLLEPWTGRRDLDGLEIIRSATYTFRARLASRFQAGRVFLLGDAAHLTPPFIGQGLAAGLRDADNLAWKIAHVLTGQAGEDLLASYETERRPHAKAMIKKAIRIGWAMTGGQDRAAAVRRIALAAAVRSDRVREVIASTATPRLKTGALQQRPRLLRSRTPATMRPGGLIANPLVSIVAGMPAGDRASAGERTPVRLDTVLRGRPAVLTARQPEPGLVELCRRHGLLLVRISAPAAAGGSAPAAAPDPQTAGGGAEVRLDGGGGAGCFQALTASPELTIIARPDRVIAAVATGSRLPRLPWSIPAAPVPHASQMIHRPPTQSTPCPQYSTEA
jgi:3-(3-hydroxy-phenyl)propionate hydroxylase